MALIIDKPKLPKGKSYPFKSSLLSEALAAKNLEYEILLQYYDSKLPRNNFLLIDAMFLYPNLRVSYHRFSISVYSVPSEERQKFEQMIKDEILNKLINWMIHLKNLSDNSTVTASGFEARYYNGDLILKD